MKRDVIIGQKLFETCKLSEFYLNLIVNSRYEDESPFQLAKAYTQKLYEIVERYDRLLEANSQRESLSLQLDNGQQQRSPAVAKPAAKSVCSTPTAVSSHLQQARTSTPNSKYSLASQLQMQLQISQSTPVTPCQSTSASSINLAATAASAHAGVMRQSSSNYQIGAANRRQNVRSTYKLNSVSNSNINSNFYKHNQQRLYSIYYDDYCSTSCSDDDDDDDHEVAGYGENSSHNNGELTVRNDDYGGGKFKTSRRKSRRDSLDMDSTILSSSNHNQHQNDDVRLDDISYDYGEYQHDTQVDLDFRHAGTRYHGNASAKEAKEIEKSYSNLSKDSGVLVDSYHSDYSSPHLNTSVRGSKAAPVTPARKPVVATPAPGKVTTTTTTTTSSSASISDNDETTGDQYIQSANETINYADDDLYDDYEGEHENDEDDFDDSEEEDDDEDEDEGVSHLCNITDSTHILLKKKATAASKIMAKQHKETPVAKVSPATTPTSLYSHYAKNPNKYSPIRASKLAFMPNKSSLISSRSSQSAATVAMATTGGQEAKLSLIAEKPDSDNNNRQLNLDLDLSMISMMVENGGSSSDERRSQSSPKTPTTTSIDQKVKLFSNKIESLTNRLKSDDHASSSLSPPLDTSSYSSSSTLSTPSPTSSSSASSSSTAAQSTDESLTTTPPPPPSPYSAACSAKTSPFLFNSISSMNVSMLDNIQVTNTSLDFDNMNTSILMFN